MKYYMFSAALVAGALGILPIQAAQAQTTVIPGKDNSTVIIKPEGQPTAVIDVNKDIEGKTKAGAESNSADAKPAVNTNADADPKNDINSDVKNAAAATKPAPETTGKVSRDNDGNLVAKPKEDCIKESWMGNRPSEKC